MKSQDALEESQNTSPRKEWKQTQECRKVIPLCLYPHLERSPLLT